MYFKRFIQYEWFSLHSNPSFYRHTGDTGIDQEPDYYDEPRHRYSFSDMITHIKRSIPDLRSIKHQPLQNKESPLGSPRASHHRLDLEQNQTTSEQSKDVKYNETDAVTLSVIAEATCTCGTAKDPSADKNAVADEMEGFHIPIPHSSSRQFHANSDLWYVVDVVVDIPTSCLLKTVLQLFSFHFSSIKNQISDLSVRLDNMETSIKNDVRTILDILHQQQQNVMQQKHPTAPLNDAPNVMTASYQPSESDTSIELFGPDKRSRASGLANVHRSVSQPECAATSKEKSLLR